MTARRLLVVGGDGLIGAFLAARFTQHGWGVRTTTRRKPAGSGAAIALDLANPAVAEASLADVDVAVFCAAMAAPQTGMAT